MRLTDSRAARQRTALEGPEEALPVMQEQRGGTGRLGLSDRKREADEATGEERQARPRPASLHYSISRSHISAASYVGPRA